MAGNQNSGGPRPTAPQNNPANISALGGNGQSGQKQPNYTGFKYGENKALAEQASGASMAQAPTSSASSQMMAPSGMPLGQLTDETNDVSAPITDGVDFGPGVGSSALPGNISAETRSIDNQAIVKKYYPAMVRAAQLKDAPDSYKRFISFLAGEMRG